MIKSILLGLGIISLVTFTMIGFGCISVIYAGLLKGVFIPFWVWLWAGISVLICAGYIGNTIRGIF